MRPHVLLAMMSLALLGFAPAPFPRTERQREDSADVAGTWEFERCEYSGRADASMNQSYTVEMTKEAFTFVHRNGGGRTIYQMRLGPAASPPSFTWSTNGRVMFVGSYRLKKGEMTMIYRYNADVANRPTDFGSDRDTLYVLRRVKR